VTGEEMERAIDFLLKSQANLEQRIEQVNSNLAARIEETNKLLGLFAQTQNEFMQTVTQTFEAQAEFNRRTDERINALVGAVERLVRDRQNGKG
jgi:DNA anti-recombination protein RmuC